MENEQLRKEFEDIVRVHADNNTLPPRVYTDENLDAAFSYFKAAAKSRDELIGRFLEAIAEVKAIGDDRTIDRARQMFCIGSVLAAVKAEAKAQGYGE